VPDSDGRDAGDEGHVTDNGKGKDKGKGKGKDHDDGGLWADKGKGKDVWAEGKGKGKAFAGFTGGQFLRPYAFVRTL